MEKEMLKFFYYLFDGEQLKDLYKIKLKSHKNLQFIKIYSLLANVPNAFVYHLKVFQI